MIICDIVLLPYIYSLAWKVTNEGYTIMRSLAFDFRNDPAINSIPDQYMFGPAFLVNPVTEPGKKSRGGLSACINNMVRFLDRSETDRGTDY